MTDQRDRAALCLQIVALLRERLAELEDDEARQAAWQATDWDLTEGVRCVRCHKPAFRFRDGVCLPCGADLVTQADRKERLRQRFLRSMKAHNARIDKRKKRGPAPAGPPQR